MREKALTNPISIVLASFVLVLGLLLPSSSKACGWGWFVYDVQLQRDVQFYGSSTPAGINLADAVGRDSLFAGPYGGNGSSRSKKDLFNAVRKTTRINGDQVKVDGTNYSFAFETPGDGRCAVIGLHYSVSHAGEMILSSRKLGHSKYRLVPSCNGRLTHEVAKQWTAHYLLWRQKALSSLKSPPKSGSSATLLRDLARCRTTRECLMAELAVARLGSDVQGPLFKIAAARGRRTRARATAINALLRIDNKDKRLLELLKTIIKDRRQPGLLKKAATWAVGKLGVPESERREPLELALRIQRPDVRCAAVFSFSELSQNSSKTALLLATMLKDRSSQVQTCALMALANMGSQAKVALPEVQKYSEQRGLRSSMGAYVEEALARITARAR